MNCKQMTREQLIAEGYKSLSLEGFSTKEGLPLYYIHPNSEMWSVNQKKPVHRVNDGNGFIEVNLTPANGKCKSFKLHRLVALEFIPNPDEYFHVLFLNGNQLCTEANNLVWGTKSRKGNFLGKEKEYLRKKVYCSTNGKTYPSVYEAAKDTDNFPGNVSAVCRGRIKRIKGHRFNYISTNDTDKSELLSKLLE